MITDAEMAVLMIAARGEFMLAIGSWEQPTKSLEAKGFMKREIINGGPQYTITDAGRAAMEAEDNKNLKAMIEKGAIAGTAQKQCRELAEQAAQNIAKCARLTSVAMGDAPVAAGERWTKVILERVADLLNG